MASLFGAFPFLIKLYADGGYQGPEFQSAIKRILARVHVEIVKKSPCDRAGYAAGVFESVVAFRCHFARLHCGARRSK